MHEEPSTLSRLLGAVAALVCIGAGIYLLQSKSAGVTNEFGQTQQTVFDVFFKGFGAYFIGRGLWMASRLRW